MKPFDNLTNKRYKTCGYGRPVLDEDGHYDDVMCAFSKEPLFCGDDACPIDLLDREPPDYDDNSVSFVEEHAEREPEELGGKL